ncbi:2-(1,2-epoxy-1,2-dihydrophenyl)acetyl-CoA isomerase [Nocardia transvalensis]|uniref:2-(1,2-epoxy-1,2-dihydrophenyl)acetyl-CoA isomerase n=1 Tax=Nocardia transvalensis TaxID=37333 RepID=A0A7W9PCZ0_9NOCA|nr:enoyl-CoA hydratase-related protein [Nocardia transvalensis]MBB5913839.1 2-(1,2-epoxy-1,2-dihydrophenyl)acetyl-CoA isomerase [Nocardia transvalensis]
MTEYETLQFEQSGSIARITLNRPTAANGIDHVLGRELAQLASRCADDPALKVVTLTGAGKFFSAGGDLKAMAAQDGSAGTYVKNLADSLHEAISSFARMDALLIIAVNGIAAGAGFSLAVVGDLVIAGESASFTMAYTRAGLSPDGGASYYLPRLIGLRRTQDLMLNNRALSAGEALDWGLVHRVVPDAELGSTVDELAERFAAGPKLSNANVKKLLLVSSSHTLEEQLARESSFISHCADSPDGQEGITAFLGKRTPKFH